MVQQVRFGVVSTARIALNQFVPAARESRLGEVVAIASRDAARAAAAAQEADIPRSHGSYEQLLADPDVDAVYIGLPNALHAEWTVRAAQAGKHVLCEKPVARSEARAQEMAAACRAAGVVYMEAFMYRHHPQHSRVRELLAAGVIGEPRLIRATFCFSMRSPRGNIRVDPGLQGGSLMDVGCYAVDVARYHFGAEPTEVVALQQVPPRFGVDITFAGLLRFSGERLAVIDCSFEVGSGGRYEVAGPDGYIAVERAFTPGSGGVTIRIATAREPRTEELPGVNQYALEIDHFARSVQAGYLLPPAEDGVANARVLEALYLSAQEGRAGKVG